jgi:hypothetical protein
MIVATQPTLEIAFVFPEDDFSHLALRMDSNSINFAWDAIDRLCRRNGVDSAILLASPVNLPTLFLVWYQASVGAGGSPNVVMEQVFAQAEAEVQHGIERVQRGPFKVQ